MLSFARVDAAGQVLGSGKELTRCLTRRAELVRVGAARILLSAATATQQQAAAATVCGAEVHTCWPFLVSNSCILILLHSTQSVTEFGVPCTMLGIYCRYCCLRWIVCLRNLQGLLGLFFQVPQPHSILMG